MIFFKLCSLIIALTNYRPTKSYSRIDLRSQNRELEEGREPPLAVRGRKAPTRGAGQSPWPKIALRIHLQIPKQRKYSGKEVERVQSLAPEYLGGGALRATEYSGDSEMHNGETSSLKAS